MLFVFTAVSGFSLQEERNLSLDATGIEGVEIECGAGILNVKGTDDLETIDVKAYIIVKGIDEDDFKSFIKDNVTLSLKKEGNRAVLISKVDFSSISSLFKKKEAKIDLEVRIPKELKLSIDDGSGSIRVSDISSNVKIEDGSGSMKIDIIKGNLKIDDGSGSITAKNIDGHVKIEDNSGEIEVEMVKGDVDVEDSSGSIKIRNVSGSVTVDDGSGSIYIDGVEQDVAIKDDGSGSLKIKNVKGKVKR
jgi:DUF4097 and DUF4098 domain-containing protein YvlB